MINLSNPNYWEDTAILRATQAWQKERAVEDNLSKRYQVFLEQIKSILSDLYAQNSAEGLLNYSDLKRRLSPYQLTQYKNRVQEIINQNRDIVDEELILELEALVRYNQLSILDAQLNILEAYLIVMVNENIETVSESLSGTYKETYNHTLYDIHRKTGTATTFDRLDSQTIEEQLFVAWTGYSFSDAIKHSRHNLNRDVRKTITSGIIRGDVYQKIVKALTKLTSGGKGYKSIRNILRGETTRLITEATARSYEQSGIKQYQFLATLDNRTTQICQNLDLNVYDVKNREIGVNAPPMHYGCRSAIMPYLDDDLSQRQRIARNEAGDNYKVPGNISFSEWNQKYNQ